MMALKTLIVLTYVLMIAMNFLANALPLGGRTTGDISAKYPSLFTPAGFTFSIWGLIYVLIAIGVWHLVRTPTEDFNATHTLVAWVFVVSSLLNVLWLLTWHHDRIVLSTIVMIALFLTLAVGFIHTPHTWTPIRLGISVYFAWVSVALIANVTIMLIAIRMPTLGVAESWWLVGILLIGLGIGLATVLTQGDVAFGLVFLWAYAGILIRHTSSAELNLAYPQAIIITIVSLCLLTTASAIQFAINTWSLYR